MCLYCICSLVVFVTAAGCHEWEELLCTGKEGSFGSHVEDGLQLYRDVTRCSYAVGNTVRFSVFAKR